MLVNKADVRIIDFAPSKDVANLSSKGSKSAAAYSYGLRPSGVSLYRAAAEFSHQGTAHNAARARTWLTKSYLGPQGWGITSEHMSAADYLKQFGDDAEREIELASLPQQARDNLSEYDLLVCYVYAATANVKALRADCDWPDTLRLADGSRVEPVAVQSVAKPKPASTAATAKPDKATPAAPALYVPVHAEPRETKRYSAESGEPASEPQARWPEPRALWGGNDLAGEMGDTGKPAKASETASKAKPAKAKAKRKGGKSKA